MKYNWAEIFRLKTDLELIRVFNGNEIKSFEARICAGKILVERNYDKEKLKGIKEDYIEKLDFEIHEIENSDKKRIKRKNTLRVVINSLIFGLIFSFVLFETNNSTETFMGINQKYFPYLVLLLFLFPILRIRKYNKKLIKELDNDLDEKKGMKEAFIHEIKI